MQVRCLADISCTSLWDKESYSAREKFERFSGSSFGRACQFGGKKINGTFLIINIGFGSFGSCLVYKNKKSVPMQMKKQKIWIRRCCSMFFTCFLHIFRYYQRSGWKMYWSRLLKVDVHGDYTPSYDKHKWHEHCRLEPSDRAHCHIHRVNTAN